MSSPTDNKAGPLEGDFGAWYLQRATRECADDLDKIRNADDFKPESVPVLVGALAQGAALFSDQDQRRILEARRDGMAAREDRTKEKGGTKEKKKKKQKKAAGKEADQ